MQRIIKIGRTLRNNWKKSTVGALALYYAAAKAKEKYEINIVMRAACEQAAAYGDSLIPMERNPTLVTVILNPVANKRKAKTEFEQYCEPLLNLAGLQVDVIQTTSEGNAKEIVETLRGTEAIIVAGGDGTLSESVTGLLRRNDDANRFPLGILPLGRTNTIGNILFPGGDGVERVKQLIQASMAIIQGHTVLKDAMKIEPLATEGETQPKPIYAMSRVEYGAFRDTKAKRDKYWMYGPFREYASFIFNGYKDALTWDCSGSLKYTPPCNGCSNCLVKRPEKTASRWSSFLMPRAQASSKEVDQSKLVNPDCAAASEICFKTSEFKIQTPNVHSENPVPALRIELGKQYMSYTDFVSDGWGKLKGKDTSLQNFPARTLEFFPNVTEKESFIEIDQEEFEVKPVKITLLPKIVKLFCKPDFNDNIK